MGKKSRKSERNSKPKGGGTTPLAAAAHSAAVDGEPLSPQRELTSVPSGAVCWICLDGGPDEGGKPMVRDCSCRGDDAGFVHLSCLVSYAETKTKELLDKGGDVDYMEPWKKCPTCCQDYQRRVGIDMAKACIAFSEENHPELGMHILKLGGFSCMLSRLKDMDLASSALREEGKRAANQMLSEIDRIDKVVKERCGSLVKDLKVVAYCALGMFVNDGTKEGDELTLQCKEEIREWCMSKGDEEGAKVMESCIRNFKAEPDEETDFSDAQSNKSLERARNSYEKIVREHGEDAVYATERVQKGIYLANDLYYAGYGLECERLLNGLEAVSRRVLGPDHPLTLEVESSLNQARRREVQVLTDGSVLECNALGFDNDTGRYDVEGEQLAQGTCQLDIDKIELAIGTPVICHEVENAKYLNGKIGDVICYDVDSCSYEVRFEDKNLKSAFVNETNLRILFDLPDLNV